MAVSEAARYLGVPEETIRRWAREGAIPAAKLDSRGGFRFVVTMIPPRERTSKILLRVCPGLVWSLVDGIGVAVDT